MTYKRKEIIGNATLYLGDFLEIDLYNINHIICDPPYEDELHAAAKKNVLRRTDGVVLKKIDFEGINKNRQVYANKIKEISNGWCIVFCLAEGVREWRDCLQKANAKYDACLAWVKPDAMPRFNGQGASRGFECAVTAWCSNGYRKWNGGGKRGVYTHLCNPSDRTGLHPTEKPIKLMKEIIKDFTNEQETILDPFMGSGSTGVAAVQMDRKFIGIELDEKYFNIACKRIEDAQRQGRLL